MRVRRDEPGPSYPSGAIPWYARWVGGPTLSALIACPVTDHDGTRPRTVTVTYDPGGYPSYHVARRENGRTVRLAVSVEWNQGTAETVRLSMARRAAIEAEQERRHTLRMAGWRAVWTAWPTTGDRPSDVRSAYRATDRTERIQGHGADRSRLVAVGLLPWVWTQTDPRIDACADLASLRTLIRICARARDEDTHAHECAARYRAQARTARAEGRGRSNAARLP